MQKLTRYVLREFCVPLGYCLAGFVSIYVLFELFSSFRRMSEAGIGVATAVRFLAGYLAPYFEWMAPACLMLAALYTMWNFCRHSELTAMRASGVGFFAIVKPMFFVALVMAAFVGWVNECYVPTHSQWAKQFRAARFRADEMEQADNVVFRSVKAKRTWNIGAVMNDEATAFEDVNVSEDWPGDEGRRKFTLRAPRAEYLDGQWWFFNPTTFYFDRSGAATPSPTPELEKLSLRSFPDFDEQPRDFLLQNRDWAFCSVSDRRRYLETHESLSEETKRNYRYDMLAQIVAPLACIVITLFAIPAGVATGRQSVFRGILTALGMFFAFYATTIGFMVLAKTGLCPPLAAAIVPDCVFFAIGCWMFRRQR